MINMETSSQGASADLGWQVARYFGANVHEQGRNAFERTSKTSKVDANKKQNKKAGL
jgi:hypothetical protein